MATAKIIIGAQDNASSVLAKISGSMGSLGGVAGILTASMAGLGLSFGALVAMAKSTIDGIDAMNDLSDATGSTVENISALEDIAKRTGTSMDTVATAMVKFNGVLKDAKPGTDAAAALTALGLSAKELKAIDPAEALLKTATALDSFADDGNKARIVQELFGKSLKDVAPLLKDLAEKGQLVATVTTEQAKEAEKFNQELFAMKKNAEDLARSLGSDLVTGINKAAKAWRESGLIAGIETLLTGDAQHKNNVALVQQTDELLSLETDIAQLRSSGVATDAAQAKKKEERLKILREEIKTTMAYRAVLSPANAPEAPKKPSLPETLGDKKTKEQKAAEDAAKKAAEEIAKTRMSMQRQLAMDAGDAVNKENQKLADDAVKYEEDIAKERLKIQRQSVLDEYDLRMKGEEDLAKAREDALKEIANKEKQFSETLHNDLKGAFSAAFRDSSGEPLQAFGDAIANVIYTRAATSLAESLIGAAGGTGSGSFLSSLFSFDGGGYTGQGARAGGLDGKGGFMAIMHPNETVTDHTRGQSAPAGQSVTVVQNFTVGDVASVAMVRQAVAGSERRIAGAMGRSMNYGGALA